MIAVPAGMRVLVATRPIDFRKGADGLVALVRETLGHVPVHVSCEIMWRRRRDDSQGRPVLIPPPHNISCLWCGRGIPLRRHAGGAQCSSSIFRIAGGLKRLRSGALGAEMDRIASYFSSLGYKRASAEIYLSRIAVSLAGSLLNIAVLGRSAKVLSTDISAPSPPTRLGLERCSALQHAWRAAPG